MNEALERISLTCRFQIKKKGIGKTWTQTGLFEKPGILSGSHHVPLLAHATWQMPFGVRHGEIGRTMRWSMDGKMDRKSL